jgi:hypothetical protein
VTFIEWGGGSREGGGQTGTGAVRDGRSWVKASLSKVQKTLSENQTKVKKSGGVVQVVKLLPQGPGPKFKSQHCQKKL